MKHPYCSLPDYCFWRRSVAQVPAQDVDPVVRGKFRISRHHRVATAGSCFAQHISRNLSNSGFNHFVTERLNPQIPQHLATGYNYGTFTARYGNIYTTKQFLQLLKRAYGLFKPIDDIWVTHDGRYVDPYRPQIQPSGFSSEREFLCDRIQHFSAVRNAVEHCDFYVFTLGLTEAWTNVEDGAVYPLCPGTVGGEFIPDRHRFVNFRMAQVLEDLREALDIIREHNCHVRFIVTVSPVGLVATAEDRHVIVSTTYSKSVLRAVCGEIDSQYDDVAYYPSYEIIMGGFNRGAYLGPDLRDVTEAGVEHVMRLFMKHYCTEEIVGEPCIESSALVINGEPKDATSIEQVVKVICDEEALDYR